MRMSTSALATWAVVAFLVLVNAFYVAAEFGTVSTPRSRIRRLAAEGNLRARRLLPVIDDPLALDRYIAASQIGITLSSLVLGAWAQVTIAPVLAPHLEPWLARWPAPFSLSATWLAVVVVLLGLAAAQVVLGELVPKALAVQYPTRTALATVVPMAWSLRLFAGFLAILNGSGLLVLRLLGLKYTGHRHVHSPEEIELLFAESRDGGLLEPDEQARLQRALRLGRLRTGDLMVPRHRVVAIAADEPFDRVLERVAASPHTRLPVYEGSLDRPIGLLHTKDVVLAYASGHRPAVRALVRPLVRVRADLPADRLLSTLRDARTPLALVEDGAGRVAGLVTLEDVAAALLGDPAERPARPAPASPGEP
jgi:putative hemolysin